MNKDRRAKVEYLCRHVVRHLPDSSAQRQQLLEAIIATLPADSEVRSDAGIMLHHMECFDDAQKRLALEFPNNNHNGGK